MKNIKENQTEMKNTITEMKNTLEGINSSWPDIEEWIGKSGDRLLEITDAK